MTIPKTSLRGDKADEAIQGDKELRSDLSF
jgi:hypothetical protein